MKIQGKVIFGLRRGRGIVEKYHARLIGLVGFRPFKGTLNIELPRDVDIRRYSTETISHKLSDGSTKVEAYMAPVRIKAERQKRVLKGIELEGDETVSTYKWKNHDAFSLRKKGKFVTWGLVETEQEKEIIEELQRLEKAPAQEKLLSSHLDCWAIQLTSGIKPKRIVEIISSRHLTEALDLHEGSPVDIEFTKK